jgi:hypothetical protein
LPFPLLPFAFPLFALPLFPAFPAFPFPAFAGAGSATPSAFVSPSSSSAGPWETLRVTCEPIWTVVPRFGSVEMTVPAGSSLATSARTGARPSAVSWAAASS